MYTTINQEIDCDQINQLNFTFMRMLFIIILVLEKGTIIFKININWGRNNIMTNIGTIRKIIKKVYKINNNLGK